jgi:hypothetical protein
MKVKENLYCIPYNKSMTTRRKDAVAYQCEKNIMTPPKYTKSKTSDKKNSPKVSPELAVSPKGSDVPFFKCNVCKRDFQDERCLKIHKTKMNHWEITKKNTVVVKRRRT